MNESAMSATPPTPPTPSSSPEEIIRASNLRKSIIRKILQITKGNPDLKVEDLVMRIEMETQGLFEQMQKIPFIQQEQAPAVVKPRSKRRGREERKDHVGRFFLALLEKPLRQEGVQECLVPIFAKSVQALIGDEAYNKFSQKIAHLLQFATDKGFDYDQVLQSKPGKEIMQNLLDLYRSEISASPSFHDQLKNKLDQALVQNSDSGSPEQMDIEGAVNKAFIAFAKLLNVSSPQKK